MLVNVKLEIKGFMLITFPKILIIDDKAKNEVGNVGSCVFTLLVQITHISTNRRESQSTIEMAAILCKG